MGEPRSPAGRKKRDVAHARTSLGMYKVQQRQILYRGRVFHFVSYEDPRVQAVPNQLPLRPSATWFLMSAGTRWGVVPQIASEEPEDTDRRLVQWLEERIT
jgi:hypothetical protein